MSWSATFHFCVNDLSAISTAEWDQKKSAFLAAVQQIFPPEQGIRSPRSARCVLEIDLRFKTIGSGRAEETETEPEHDTRASYRRRISNPRGSLVRKRPGSIHRSQSRPVIFDEAQASSTSRHGVVLNPHICDACELPFTPLIRVKQRCALCGHFFCRQCLVRPEPQGEGSKSVSANQKVCKACQYHFVQLKQHSQSVYALREAAASPSMANKAKVLDGCKIITSMVADPSSRSQLLDLGALEALRKVIACYVPGDGSQADNELVDEIVSTLRAFVMIQPSALAPHHIEQYLETLCSLCGATQDQPTSLFFPDVTLIKYAVKTFAPGTAVHRRALDALCLIYEDPANREAVQQLGGLSTAVAGLCALCESYTASLTERTVASPTQVPAPLAETLGAGITGIPRRPREGSDSSEPATAVPHRFTELCKAVRGMVNSDSDREGVVHCYSLVDHFCDVMSTMLTTGGIDAPVLQSILQTLTALVCSKTIPTLVAKGILATAQRIIRATYLTEPTRVCIHAETLLDKLDCRAKSKELFPRGIFAASGCRCFLPDWYAWQLIHPMSPAVDSEILCRLENPDAKLATPAYKRASVRRAFAVMESHMWHALNYGLSLGGDADEFVFACLVALPQFAYHYKDATVILDKAFFKIVAQVMQRYAQNPAVQTAAAQLLLKLAATARAKMILANDNESLSTALTVFAKHRIPNSEAFVSELLAVKTALQHKRQPQSPQSASASEPEQ